MGIMLKHVTVMQEQRINKDPLFLSTAKHVPPIHKFQEEKLTDINYSRSTKIDSFFYRRLSQLSHLGHRTSSKQVTGN